MLNIDIIISIAFMALIFYRQLAIFKDPSKLNYAPLMLSLSVITSLFHLLFIASDKVFDIALRESLFPFFVGTFLYGIMNIMHQKHTKERERSKSIINEKKIEDDYAFKKQVSLILNDLEKKVFTLHEEELRKADDYKSTISTEIKALENVQSNQLLFVNKIEALIEQQENILKNFETFAHQELPDLDQVVHSHIDILRISEKDHFNKVTAQITSLESTIEEHNDEIKDIENIIASIMPSINNLVEKVIEETDKKINSLFKEYSTQMQHLRSQGEDISLSMREYDNYLTNLKEQTALFLKQTVLASQRMEEIAQKSSLLSRSSSEILDMIEQLKLLKEDYKKSKISLELLIDTMKSEEKKEFESMKNYMESLMTLLHEQMDQLMKDIDKTYNITRSEISPTVKSLNKAKLIKQYQNEEDGSSESYST